MLSANPTVLLNEIRKKQGRTIFALCRACGLAPADGATAKFYLLKHGYVVEHSASSGLFLVNRSPQPATPPVKRVPVENPYQVLRRNEPLKVTGEETGRLTSEAKSQRAATEQLEQSERTDAPAYVMAKPKPIKEKTLAEQIREELEWHANFDRERAERDAEEEFVEEAPETDQDREDLAQFDREHAEPETELEEEEMANLSPTALNVLEKARAAWNTDNVKEEEPAKAPVVFGKNIPVPTTPGGKPLVSDEMILEFLTDRGPATMGTITTHFGRTGCGLATKLSKMVKHGIICQRDKVPGVLIVYLTKGDYLKEIGKSLPEQKLPVMAKTFNVERGTMLHTREQTTAVAAEEIKPKTLTVFGMNVTEQKEIEPGVMLVDNGAGLVKVAEFTSFTPHAKTETFESPGVSVYEPPKKVEQRFPTPVEISANFSISVYDVMEPVEQQAYLSKKILESLEHGNKNLIVLAAEFPEVPSADIHKALGLLNQRRRILKCQPDEISSEYLQSERKRYAFWKLAPVNERKKRQLSSESILALFTDSNVLDLATLAAEFQRTASTLAPTMNVLVREGRLVKVAEAPAQYRKPNASLASILDEIDKSFSVKTIVEKPDENWFPILNRLEILIGGDAGAVLAEIQAYLKRRLKDD